MIRNESLVPTARTLNLRGLTVCKSHCVNGFLTMYKLNIYIVKNVRALAYGIRAKLEMLS